MKKASSNLPAQPTVSMKTPQDGVISSSPEHSEQNNNTKSILVCPKNSKDLSIILEGLDSQNPQSICSPKDLSDFIES